MKRGSGWPLSIGAFFALATVFLAGFVFFAATRGVDLVSDDYYAWELVHQEQIERERRTRDLPETPAWAYRPESRHVMFSFPASIAGRTRDAKAVFYRPSDRRLDRSVPLDPSSAGAVSVDVSGFASGLWRVRLRWTMEDLEYYKEDVLVLPNREDENNPKIRATKAGEGSGVNYPVVIELDEIPDNLRWGMTAFVDIQVD